MHFRLTTICKRIYDCSLGCDGTLAIFRPNSEIFKTRSNDSDIALEYSNTGDACLHFGWR